MECLDVETNSPNLYTKRYMVFIEEKMQNSLESQKIEKSGLDFVAHMQANLKFGLILT